jgi:hypothetical protein
VGSLLISSRHDVRTIYSLTAPRATASKPGETCDQRCRASAQQACMHANGEAKMRIFPFVATLIAFLSSLCQSSISWADSAELFNGAVAKSNSLDQGLPTKERLQIFAAIFSALDKIVAEEPGSKEALVILSGQSVGNFSPSVLRSSYIKELTDFHDKVCEVTPSYTCLAFVSLKKGMEIC